MLGDSYFTLVIVSSTGLQSHWFSKLLVAKVSGSLLFKCYAVCLPDAEVDQYLPLHSLSVELPSVKVNNCLHSCIPTLFNFLVQKLIKQYVNLHSLSVQLPSAEGNHYLYSCIPTLFTFLVQEVTNTLTVILCLFCFLVQELTIIFSLASLLFSPF